MTERTTPWAHFQLRNSLEILQHTCTDNHSPWIAACHVRVVLLSLNCHSSLWMCLSCLRRCLCTSKANLRANKGQLLHLRSWSHISFHMPKTCATNSHSNDFPEVIHFRASTNKNSSLFMKSTLHLLRVLQRTEATWKRAARTLK